MYMFALNAILLLISTSELLEENMRGSDACMLFGSGCQMKNFKFFIVPAVSKKAKVNWSCLIE